MKRRPLTGHILKTEHRGDLYRSFHDWINFDPLIVKRQEPNWSQLPLWQLRLLLQEYEIGKPHRRGTDTHEQCVKQLQSVGFVNPPVPYPNLRWQAPHSVKFLACSSKLVFVANEYEISVSRGDENFIVLGHTRDLFRSCFEPPELPLSSSSSSSSSSSPEHKNTPPTTTLRPNDPILIAAPVRSSPIKQTDIDDEEARQFWAAKLPKLARDITVSSHHISNGNERPLIIDWTTLKFTSSVWPWRGPRPFPSHENNNKNNNNNVDTDNGTRTWHWELVANCPNSNCLKISESCRCQPRFIPSTTSQIANPNILPKRDPYAHILIRAIAWDSIRNILCVAYGHSICRIFLHVNKTIVINKIECIGYPDHAGNKDGPGTSARFSFPSAIASDLRGRGEIWIADSMNKRIRKIDSLNIVTTTTLEIPLETHGLIVDHLDRIWTSHTFQHIVMCRVVEGGGKPICYGKYEGTVSDDRFEHAQFHNPMGLSIDSLNNIYVADQGNNRIRKIETCHGMVRTISDPFGQCSRKNGLPMEANCAAILNLTVDPLTAQIFVAESGGTSVEVHRIFPISQTFAYLAAGAFHRTPLVSMPEAVATILQFLIYGPIDFNEVTRDQGEDALVIWKRKLVERLMVRKLKAQRGEVDRFEKT